MTDGRLHIAVAGKGGSGKTTVAGTLARLLGRSGRRLVAVDADTNPNLAAMLGFSADRAAQVVALPRTLLARDQQDDGTVKTRLARDPLDVISEYAVSGPDNVRLVVMGAVNHAAAGCMCGAHATARNFVSELIDKPDAPYDVLIDTEAGLEHFSRGTARHVSMVLAVVEPYYRSMETLRRIAYLARELGIGDVRAVVNKLRDGADTDTVRSFCQANGVSIAVEIPSDEAFAAAERAGQAALDYAPHAPGVEAIRRLADRLLAPA